MFAYESCSNLTYGVFYLVFGGKTLNSESETNLVFGCVMQKFLELSLVNVKKHVNSTNIDRMQFNEMCHMPAL